MRQKQEASPLHIMSAEELRQFSPTKAEARLPWNYRVTARVVGVIMRPLLRKAGHSELTKTLGPGEKEELSELLTIVREPEQWNLIDPLRQLDLRKRASRLVERTRFSRLWQ